MYVFIVICVVVQAISIELIPTTLDAPMQYIAITIIITTE